MCPVDLFFPDLNRQRDIDRMTCNQSFGCGKEIFSVESEFRDELSVKEFGISGLCQDCQDGIFDGPEAA